MHRNEGSGMLDEGGIPRFIDKNLPGTPGSKVLAEWGNAVTEELINVILAAGLEPEASAADDRTNGWNQLATAIFNNQAIGTAALAGLAVTAAKIAEGAVTNAKLDDEAVNTAKVSSLDLAKLFGTLGLATNTPSVTSLLTLSALRLSKTKIDTGEGEYSFDLDEHGLDTSYIDLAGLVNRQIYGHSGQFTPFMGEQIGVKIATFDLPAGGWSALGGNVYKYTGTLANLGDFSVVASQVVIDIDEGGGVTTMTKIEGVFAGSSLFQKTAGNPDATVEITIQNLNPTGASVLKRRLTVWYV